MKLNFDETRVGGWIAVAGIFLVAGVSIAMNWQFWEARGDRWLAWLTVGAALVAVGGFVMVLHHWRDRRLRAVGGLAVTLLAAGWEGMTVFERLNAEAHDQSVAAAMGTDAYRQAQRELEAASTLFQGALAAEVPAGLGPLTTDAVARANELRARRLGAERNRAQARLAALTPTATIDLIALLRGFGIQIATLLGLAVFGSGVRPKELGADKSNTEEEPIGPRPLTASELGKLGAAAKAARRQEEIERRRRQAAYMRDYRARRSGKWPASPFGERPDAQLH